MATFFATAFDLALLAFAFMADGLIEAVPYIAIALGALALSIGAIAAPAYRSLSTLRDTGDERGFF